MTDTATTTDRSADRAADTAARTVPVWDPLVRLGHWGLVATFAIAWFTAEDGETLHVLAGYGLAAIVLIRLAWGFLGPRHARFADFVRSPAQVLAYLRGLATGNAPRSLGHNPAGGAMVVALLLALSGTAFSGLALLAVEEGEGPLAGWIAAPAAPAELSGAPTAAFGDRDDDGYGRGARGEEHEGRGEAHEGTEEAWEEIHEVFANLSLFLIVVHVLGVIASGRAHGENLVLGMITGRKRAEP
jgi:cytochrome b